MKCETHTRKTLPASEFANMVLSGILRSVALRFQMYKGCVVSALNESYKTKLVANIYISFNTSTKIVILLAINTIRNNFIYRYQL